MTVVNVSVFRPQQSGVNAPVDGFMQWVPTATQYLSPDVVLPVPFQVALASTTPVVPVTVAATGPGWAWRVDTHVIGFSPTTQYFTIPSGAPVAFSDLVQVDPATLTPSTAPAQPAGIYSALSFFFGG